MPYVQDLLVKQGISFSNYIVNISLCCPSRATILTGQYGQNTGIVENRPPNGGFEIFLKNGLEDQTIAVRLQAAGYYTGFVGKYLNGYPNEAGRGYIPPGWNEWYSPVSGNPYNEYSYTLNENGRFVTYHHKPEHYLTDVLAGKAADYLQRIAPGDQPFFLVISTYAPHGPSTPAPRHRSLFTDYQIPQLNNYNETDTADKPAYIRELKKFKRRSTESLRRLTIRRLQSLQAVDEMVLRLITTLDQAGELDNTYIFYSSDNGFHLGQHRLRPGKSTPYEEDIRVPLVVRGPEIPAGKLIPSLAGNADLAPSFADLAGLPLPVSCDGRSLVPLFSGKNPASWRGAYPIGRWGGDEEDEAGISGPSSSFRLDILSNLGLLEPPDEMETTWDGQNTFKVPPFSGLRGQYFVYVEYATGEVEYYNLANDPYELSNLAALLPAEKLRILREWLDQVRSCQGASCRIAEQVHPGFTP